MNVYLKRIALVFVIAFTGVVVVSGIAYAASTLNPIANNTADTSAWNRAVGYSQDTGAFYAFGGGHLGSSIGWSDQIWSYNAVTDIWTNTGVTLPGSGERFVNHTYGSGGRYIGMVSSNLPGCDTFIWDAVLGSIATAVDPPQGCAGAASGTAVGSNFWFCAATSCEILNMTNPAAGWSTASGTPTAGGWQNGYMVYDPEQQIILRIKGSSNAVEVYEISTGQWTVVTAGTPFTTPASVAFYDNRFGIVAGEKDTPIANSIEIHQFVFNETTPADSTWTLAETWTDPNFNYTATFGFRGGTLTLTGGSNETRFIFGSSTTFSATPGAAADRWWRYEGNSPLTVITQESGNIDFWIEQTIDLLDLDDEFGHHLFGLFWLLVVALMARRAEIHPLIMLFIVGLTATGFAQAEILPGWTILVAIIVLMTAFILRMVSGQSTEGEPV